MKICIDVDYVRECLIKKIKERRLLNPKSEIGKSYNDGIDIACLLVDIYFDSVNLNVLKGDRSDG